MCGDVCAEKLNTCGVDTALSWAAKIGRIPAHYVYRSFHVYRALLPLGCSLNEEAVAVILSILYKHEAKRPIDRIGLAIDIMHTFIVRSPPHTHTRDRIRGC